MSKHTLTEWMAHMEAPSLMHTTGAEAYGDPSWGVIEHGGDWYDLGTDFDAAKAAVEAAGWEIGAFDPSGNEWPYDDGYHLERQ